MDNQDEKGSQTGEGGEKKDDGFAAYQAALKEQDEWLKKVRKAKEQQKES